MNKPTSQHQSGSAFLAGRTFILLSTLVLVVLCAFSTLATAGNLSNDGSNHIIFYNSNHLPQDFTIPNGPSYIELNVRGAEGGRAHTNECNALGGSPAMTTANFEVGSGSGQLKPGGEIRFIIGERGGDDNAGRDVAGGGGGGSAVLYKKPSDDDWNDATLLMAAGGGGGGFAFQSVWSCDVQDHGGDARTGTGGGDGGGDSGGDGGSSGCSGENNDGDTSGGGGGDHNCGSHETRQGYHGYPAGGNGGSGTDGADGGWGYGGGGGSKATDTIEDFQGGAGGGGGYSGGGGGGLGCDGGGGGSYIKSWAISESIVVTSFNDDGAGSYRCVDSYGGTSCDGATWVGAGSFNSSTSGYPGNPSGVCNGETQPGAWYEFSNPETWAIDVTVSTQPDGLSRKSIGVFTDCGGSPGSMIGCSGFPNLDPVTWTMQPGESDIIRIGAFSTVPPGGGTAYSIDISYTPTPITNTTCATAMPLQLGTNIVTNHGTDSTGSLPCTPPATSRNAWYIFENTASQDKVIEIGSHSPEFGR